MEVQILEAVAVAVAAAVAAVAVAARLQGRCMTRSFL
jgi:hypothetical protein